MRTYAGSQKVVSVLEGFEARELREISNNMAGPVFEDFRELFLGPADEPAEASAVRREAARAVLAELLAESRDDEISMLNAVYAVQLSSLAPLRQLTEFPLVGRVAA
ncbi:hypothetical protein [Streptomyces niveus]|uniref:Uncharacterized protein n=1 Tax=Streptomyces niveus TaxID=193462 RepID=A0ABZ2A5L9_STRNV|nr:hypothetical protein [Streptomyces niveus]